jgi:hypothetical protein
LSGAEAAFDHVWHWRCRLPERKGQRCRVLVRAPAMNSILVQFEDGLVVVTSRFAVRRRQPPASAGRSPQVAGSRRPKMAP